jgi:ABC-type nitrate/sulfonate/bicarbonate transport system substrate-binding protein
MDIDTIWYTYCPGPNAVGIASSLNWLADEFEPDGITVRTLASSTADSRDVRDAHQLVPKPELFPNIFRHGGNPPPLVALSRGVDLRIVGLTWTEAARRILTFPDSGIRTPEDLKGRRLSLPKRNGMAVDYLRSVTLRTYSEALAAAGFSFDDVELVEVESQDARTTSVAPPRPAPLPYNATLWSAWTNAGSQTDEALALARGEVDVVASEHAQAAVLQALLKLHTVFDTRDSASPNQRASGDQPLVLTVNGSLLDERPDIVERWISRSLEAADWATQNRSEARRFVASDAGLPEDFVDTAYSTDVSDQLGIGFDEKSIAGLQVQHDHLLAHGFLEGAGFEVEKFFDRGPFEAAREKLAAAPAAA